MGLDKEFRGSTIGKAGNGVQRVQHGVQRGRPVLREAGFAGQPFSMKRILREAGFAGRPFFWRAFFYKARGGGALRAP